MGKIGIHPDSCSKTSRKSGLKKYFEHQISNTWWQLQVSGRTERGTEDESEASNSVTWSSVLVLTEMVKAAAVTSLRKYSMEKPSVKPLNSVDANT